MSLADWLADRWIVTHEPSVAETAGIAAKTVDLLDAVRRKRNQNSYEHAGTTSAAEAQELHLLVKPLRGDVLRWLRKTHPGLCPLADAIERGLARC